MAGEEAAGVSILHRLALSNHHVHHMKSQDTGEHYSLLTHCHSHSKV